MKLVNLTPHELNIKTDRGVLSVKPSGTVARASVRQVKAGSINVDGFEIPVVRTKFGEVTGIPEPKEGTIYLVSSLVCSRMPERPDVLAPDTGSSAIRDENGRIQAVTQLQKP